MLCIVKRSKKRDRYFVTGAIPTDLYPFNTKRLYSLEKGTTMPPSTSLF